MTESELPLITVCMPVKDRLWSLKTVLNILENIYYPKRKLKVIFVDDFSTDGSYEFLMEWTLKARSMNFYKVDIIRAKSNIPQARNICIDHMEGDYLLYWDSDVVPPSELLLDMVKLMEKDKNIGIIGADYIYDPTLNIKYVPTLNKRTNVVYMGFTLIRKDVFETIGKFNETLTQGEDTEFCLRVRERTHYIIYWSPKPVLHLKRGGIDINKPGTFKAWLKFNFTKRAEEYLSTWDNLPKFLKIRIIYWILWPWVLGSMVYVFTLKNIGIIIVLFSILYIFASAFSIVVQKGFIYGFKQWIRGNVPTGLALSYGILVRAMVYTLRVITMLISGREK